LFLADVEVVACGLHAQANVMFYGGGSGLIAKQRGEMGGGEPGVAREFLKGKRARDISAHEFNALGQVVGDGSRAATQACADLEKQNTKRMSQDMGTTQTTASTLPKSVDLAEMNASFRQHGYAVALGL
jgi:hypothetical protein